MSKVLKLILVFSLLATSVSFIGAIAQTTSDQIRLEQTKLKELSMKGKANYIDSGADAGFLQLTPSQPFVSGSAFYKDAVDISQNRSFSTYFTTKMTNSTKGGADGIVFVVSSNPYDLGRDGGGIGYLGVKDSVGIEFDTFNNNSIYADPDGNHIAINTNGDLTKPLSVVQTKTLEAANLTFDDGKLRHVWIEYDGSKQTMFVRVANENMRPVQPLISLEKLNLTSILKTTSVYVGFTSATGDATSSHLIGKFYFDKNYLLDGIPAELPSGGTPIQPPPVENTKPVVEEKTWESEDAKQSFISGKVVGTDAENDTLKYTIFEQPKNGQLQFNRDTGVFTYTPIPKFSGTDFFEVTAHDGKLFSVAARQQLLIKPVNVLPVAVSQQLTVVEDSSVKSKLEASDENKDSLTYIIHSTPAKGVVNLNEITGEFEYIPNPGQSGVDSFQIIVYDGKGDSLPASVEVQITKEPLVSLPANEQVTAGTSLEKKLTFKPASKDASKFSFVIRKPVRNGLLTLDEFGGYKYTPNKGFVGVDRFSFAIYDGLKLTNTSEITIQVTSPVRVSYMNGYVDKQFKPMRSITRAELAAAIVRLTGVKATESPVIRDVVPTNWMYSEILAVHSNRIMTADSRMNFTPNRAVSRQEMNAVITKLLQQKLISAEQINNARKEVIWLADITLKLRKQEKIEVSRLETVITLNRIFNRVPISVDGKTSSPWTDVKPNHPNFRDIIEASNIQ